MANSSTNKNINTFTGNLEEISAKLPLILVLGSNIFSKKSINSNEHIENYEIVNLKYLPTIGQIEGLSPDLIILNLQNQKDEFLSGHLKLCNDIKEKQGSNIPIVCICSENTKKSMPNSIFSGHTFNKIWNTSIESKNIFEDINEIVTYGQGQRRLWSTLNELESFKNAIYQELEQASIFQGALFNQALAKTNLPSSYHYFFRRDIGGDFFKTFDLSPSHVGIIIGDVRGNGAAAALLMGFILGELYSISSAKDRVLWSPSEMLARLSESIYSHNKMSELCASAWYGVLDLTTGKIRYARAGHPLPLFSEPKQSSVSFIEGGSGFPMGIFPGMAYKEHELQLPEKAYLLLYTDGLATQKDKDNNQVGMRWLNECFGKLCSEGKPVTDFPAVVDSTFTDLVKGVEITDDRVILGCQLPSVNQSYVKVVNQDNDKDKSQLSKIEINSLQLTIDQILASIPSINEEERTELDLSLQELFFKANLQVQRARLIALTEDEESTATGFSISWWVSDNQLDISVTLDSGSVPWSFIPYPSSIEGQNLEQVSSLIFFFEDITVNSNGMEISMRKFFNS